MPVFKAIIIAPFLSLFVFVGCKNSENNLIPASQNENAIKRNLPEEFKTYWYDGNAEITSYNLLQERYGELRKGKAVNIFVTEDFLPEAQVKANNISEENIPVLKLNQVKKYVTGIYPYSVMTSAFSPLNSTQHAVKLSFSMQEWCGQAYVQLNNRKEFEIISHSYFEGEADQSLSLTKTWLESEIWNLIRINPNQLPTGDLSVLPSFEYFRMSHQKIESKNAYGKLMQGDSLSTYTLEYPEIKRSLAFYFNSQSPYEIERWEETHPNGLKTTAEKLRRIKSKYWSQNGTQFEFLRDSLLLN
ncbi:septum formation inhibitor Maf [Aureisphaera sp. CAU 1614]|uniref:Septum formation inhibitor Maf n=1 Tax=Halomarinibacterium sedimenti TaxID=2857106 RepID=A0A9X1JVE0_9FLAO|nr:septum formation inhibitor Maf [Halomarinibacterium sedimenti]MBW2937625.1 septum formation inhibitor Maf [Halomarinibacterium sedimenti]